MLKYSVVVRVPAWLNSCLDIHIDRLMHMIINLLQLSSSLGPAPADATLHGPTFLVVTGARKPILNITVRVIDHVVPEGAGLIKMQIGVPPNTM